MDRTTLSPLRIETVEIDAWRSMFDAAPADFRREMRMRYEVVGGGICLLFASHPVVHFNMVMGLGLREPMTGQVLRRVEDIYLAGGQSTYMIHHIPQMEPANAEEILDAMGYVVRGGWERILWEVRPVAEPEGGRDIVVTTVDAGSVLDWEHFVVNTYKYPAQGWLRAFWNAEGWVHFLAHENGRLVASRSLFAGRDGMAWSGIDTPVPIVMTDDLEPDRAILRRMQRLCVERGLRYLAADIEKPSPGRDTKVYESFRELGFWIPYLRQLYRKRI